MVSNAYFLAKFRCDIAENEPAKNLQNLLIIIFPILLTLTLTQSVVTGKPELGLLLGDAAAGVLERRHGPVGYFRQNFARFRLYWPRSLQANTRFAAIFKIYQII